RPPEEPRLDFTHLSNHLKSKALSRKSTVAPVRRTDHRFAGARAERIVETMSACISTTATGRFHDSWAGACEAPAQHVCRDYPNAKDTKLRTHDGPQYPHKETIDLNGNLILSHLNGDETIYYANDRDYKIDIDNKGNRDAIGLERNKKLVLSVLPADRFYGDK